MHHCQWSLLEVRQTYNTLRTEQLITRLETTEENTNSIGNKRHSMKGPFI